MGYQKVAATTSPVVPATIQFYYSSDSMFRFVKLRSSFRARAVKDQAGNAQLDDISISNDEKTLVLHFLRESIENIFMLFRKVSDTITEKPTAVDINFIPTGGTEGKYSVGKVIDNNAYDPSILQIIDTKIENCIQYFIMSEWYLICGMENDAKINALKYQEYLKEINNLSFELRRPLLT